MEADPREDPIARLERGRARWARLPASARAQLLRACLAATLAVSEEWTRQAAALRGLADRSDLVGEELLDGPYVLLRLLRLLAEGLEAPRPTLPARVLPSGRTLVEVFPLQPPERLLWAGFSAEVWLTSGGARATRPLAGGLAAGAPGGVALVLGAGNITSIAPTDALHQLVFEDSVVALKLHPLMEPLRAVLEEALGPLVREGYLILTQGEAEAGDRLARDPRVGRVHLTGSRQTYEALMWGACPEEAGRRRAEGRPRLDKPVTAELGCVSPVIVAPGRWSEAELAWQARHLAGMVHHNAGFDCVAAQVVLTDAGWPQRIAFLNHLRQALARVAPRPAWFPGAEARHERIRARHPQAERLGRESPGGVPWTLVPDLDPREGSEALQEEAFCGLLFELPLAVEGGRPFLDRAVDFVNERCLGDLSATLLMDPRSLRAQARAVEVALERLGYGVIGVNVWPGVAFALPEIPWGARPGNRPEAIGSGVGFVHNAFGLSGIQKVVLRAPFRTLHLPPWFPGHPNLLGLGRAMCAYEEAPGWRSAAGIAWEAFRPRWVGPSRELKVASSAPGSP